MTSHSQFLTTLCAPEIRQRLTDFRASVVPHRRLDEVREAVLRSVVCPDDATITAVCGPTSVGKSTLCSLIAQDLAHVCGPSVEGADPILEMHCPDPRLRGGYNMERDHWEALQRAVGDPFLDSHFCPDDAAARRRSGKEKHTSGRRSASRDLRRAAESYLRLRGTQFLLLDEAHHIAIVSTDQRAIAHMHTLKVFGDTTGVQQVLFGTEALLPLLRRGGELTRRAAEVFFHTYRFDNDDDVEAFSEAFCHLSRLLPCADPHAFEANLREVFEGSLGSVGLLKEQITRLRRVRPRPFAFVQSEIILGGVRRGRLGGRPDRAALGQRRVYGEVVEHRHALDDSAWPDSLPAGNFTLSVLLHGTTESLHLRQSLLNHIVRFLLTRWYYSH